MRGIVMLGMLCAGCLPDGEQGIADLAMAPDAGETDMSTVGTDGAAQDLAPSGVPFVYVSGSGAQIARYRMNAATGALTSLGNTPAAGNPSFLAIDVVRRHLYAADETGSQVRAFSMDASGALTSLGAVSSGGSGPAHVSVHPSGAWVLVANYGDGKVAVLPVQSNGSLGAASDVRTAGANAHQIFANAAGTVVYVPCLGANYVAQYSFDATLGKLTPLAPATVAAAAGAGPRHLALYPGKSFAYLINELNSTMTAYAIDSGGRLTSIHTLSTLPSGFSGSNTGAEVWVHPSGSWVYGSNRGDDSIVRYTLDSSTGRMTLGGHDKSGGTTPRSFAIDPSGRFLLAANQGSNLTVVFAIDATTGALTATGNQVTTTGPTFVEVVLLAGP